MADTSFKCRYCGLSYYTTGDVRRHLRKKHPEWAGLRRADRQLVRALAAVLRLTIGLDRSHAAQVDDVSVAIDDDDLTVTLHARDGADIELEAHAAELRRGLLEDVTGRDVHVTIG